MVNILGTEIPIDFPFGFKYALFLLLLLATTVTFLGISLSSTFLEPLFGFAGILLNAATGVKVNTDYRIVVGLFFLVGIFLFINHMESSH